MGVRVPPLHMSNYFFLLILVIIITGLYYIKSFSKTSLGLISLIILMALLVSLVMVGVTKLNLFVVEPWRLFVIIFMGILYYTISKEKNQNDFEEVVLVVVTLLGSIVVVTCDHLVVLYLGLELQTFSLFILISRNKVWAKGPEAGLKYFIMGALSSGIFLLGLVMIFVKGHSLSIQDLIGNYSDYGSGVETSTALIIMSLFFKIGLFPLHFWIPDVYEGSSWKILTLVGSLPKVSTICVLIQFKVLVDIVLICCILSIVIGTLGALNQSKLKRLLAYSGISHIGFMVLILCVSNQESSLVVNIYLIIYMLSILYVMILSSQVNLTRDSYIIEIANHKTILPLVTLSWAVLFLSIGGIPPLSGFISKWLVLWSILEEGYLLSSLICIIFSSIGVFYYLRVVKTLYFQGKSNYIIWGTTVGLEQRENSSQLFSGGLYIYMLSFLIINPNPLFLLVEGLIIGVN